jgi:hypothetical protein
MTLTWYRYLPSQIIKTVMTLTWYRYLPSQIIKKIFESKKNKGKNRINIIKMFKVW